MDPRSRSEKASFSPVISPPKKSPIEKFEDTVDINSNNESDKDSTGEINFLTASNKDLKVSCKREADSSDKISPSEKSSKTLKTLPNIPERVPVTEESILNTSEKADPTA